MLRSLCLSLLSAMILPCVRQLQDQKMLALLVWGFTMPVASIAPLLNLQIHKNLHGLVHSYTTPTNSYSILNGL